MGLRAHHYRLGDAQVVAFSGDFDLGTVPQISDALTKVIAEADERIVIDLDGIGVPDDNALAMLMVAISRAAEVGKKLEIQCSSADIAHHLSRFSLPLRTNLER